MKTSFHRIYTSDGLELQGLLYEPDNGAKKILVHVHGMAGNFYENKFCDFLAKTLTDTGIAFCAFNNRGAEFIKDINKIGEGGSQSIIKGGTAYEKFTDSIFDIHAVLNFAAKQKSKTIHLSGHSLGSPKVAYYITETKNPGIKSILFLSPSDILGLARQEKEIFSRDIVEATMMQKNGEGNDFISHKVWDIYPMSADTYLDLFADDSKAGIFNFFDSTDPLEVLGRITIPTFAVMGRKDDALVIPIEETFARLEAALKSSPKIKTEILGDADHEFLGDEQPLADAVKEWLESQSE